MREAIDLLGRPCRWQGELGRALLPLALLLWVCCSCGLSTPESSHTEVPPTATLPARMVEGVLLVTDTPGMTASPTQQPPTRVHPTHTPIHTATPRPPTATATSLPTITSTPKPERQVAQVVGVIDGDTIEVEIDGQRYRLRYIGVDSPEPRDRASSVIDAGVQAAQVNEELVGGKTVWLEKDISETDQYDRLLRYVYVGELFVNAEMVRRGYAEAKRYEPDVRYQALFEQLQVEARAAKRGFWGATPTPLPTPPLDQAALPPPDTAATGQGHVRVAAHCCQFDAPGNDHDNLGEEYVCLENAGTAAVDLSGWCVKDEKDHTYCFPAFTLEPGALVRVHTGAGADSASDLYWNHDGAVWNNGGDTVYVYNAGGALVCEFGY
jgi:micrococcal nuclease